MHTPLHHTQRWYFGRIKRVEAEKQLMMSFNQYVSYLVRESEITLGDFSLSICDTEFGTIASKDLRMELSL